MNPSENNSNSETDTISQSLSVEKQMNDEQKAIEDAQPKIEQDRSIVAEPSSTLGDTPSGTLDDAPNNISNFTEPKPLSEIAASPKIEENASLVNLNSIEDESKNKPRRKLNKIPLIIAGALVVVALLGVAVWKIAEGLNVDNGGAVANAERTAFFLASKKDNDIAAIFDDTGKQLTGFIYSSENSFNSLGYAAVEKEGQYAIVANTGKLSVPYGEYEKITAVGADFVAAVDGANYFIDGSGRRIAQIDDYSTDRGFINLIQGADSLVYTTKGKEIGTLKSKTTKDYASSNSDASFQATAISIDDVFYVVRDTDGELLFEYKGISLETMSVKDINDDASIIIVCGKEKGTTADDNTCIIRMNGKDVVFKYGSDKYVYYPHIFPHANKEAVAISLEGVSSGWEYIGEDGSSWPRPHSGDVYSVYFDSKNYAYIDERGIAHFVFDGEEKIIDDVREISYSAATDSYAVEIKDSSTDDWRYYTVIYSKKGEQLVKIDGRLSDGSIDLDGSGNYIFNSKYFDAKLFYKDGSPSKFDYESIKPLKNGKYIVKKANTYGVVNETDEITINTGLYKSFAIIGDEKLFIAEANDGKMSLYNGNFEQVLKEYDSIIDRGGYIEAAIGDKIEYYTYDCVKFYEV